MRRGNTPITGCWEGGAMQRNASGTQHTFLRCAACDWSMRMHWQRRGSLPPSASGPTPHIGHPGNERKATNAGSQRAASSAPAHTAHAMECRGGALARCAEQRINPQHQTRKKPDQNQKRNAMGIGERHRGGGGCREQRVGWCQWTTTAGRKGVSRVSRRKNPAIRRGERHHRTHPTPEWRGGEG